MLNKLAAVVVAIAATQSKKNPDFYWAQLRQELKVIDGNFVRTSARTCIVNGSKEDLAGLTVGTALDGKIVVKEQMEPINPDNPEQGKKMAGDTGIACTVNGLPIYRSTYFSSDLSEEDTLIAHDNGDAISAAYAEKQAEESADLGE